MALPSDLPLPAGAKIPNLGRKSGRPAMRAILCRAFVLPGPNLTPLAGTCAVTDQIPADPYAWLEDVHGVRPLQWVAAQNRQSLDRLKADPRYSRNFDTALALMDAADRIPYGRLRHGHVYNFWQDAANPKGLWRRTAIADYRTAAPRWEVLLDVDALARAEGENWVYKGADCAPGEERCLISLSRGGGDAVVVREFDLRARDFVIGGFALAEAKSTGTYLDDDTVLFATAADAATQSGYGRIVRMWKRGTPLAGARTLYEGQVTDVLVAPETFPTPDGNLAVIARAVSFFETDYFMLGAGQAVWKLPVPRALQLQGVVDGRLIFTLREDWQVPGGPALGRGALAALALEGTDAAHTGDVTLLYAPGPRASVESVGVGRTRIYAAITENVIGAVHVFTPRSGGWDRNLLDLPGQGTAGIVTVNPYGPEAMIGFENYLTPPTVYFADGDTVLTPVKSLPARFDASGLVTEQFEAVSADGTPIPYFVTRPGNLPGPAPTLLYGYGGFEVSLTPSYGASVGREWLARGGIYVVANIRGGGEFGPAWHDAALKTHRQRAFDDFAAVAADLSRRGLTTPGQLGIMGGSNGGLLVSTVMVQHPELIGAVVCQVPLIDMLAFSRIGAGASWVGEYGDPADPRERAYLLSYSPYQNVKPDVSYPPVFFVTATSDDRVSPVHARKMAARMQEQGHEVLFYENTDGGHAAAADHRQRAEMFALSFVYLAQKLGLK
jgi:prolyl oligopeptidase